jgi:hypothetical protein
VERGVRYVPDKNRNIVSEYMSQPQIKQNAEDWVNQQMPKQVFCFLSASDQKLYLSASGLLLSIKQLNLILSDYSILVMPFARVYEGFVIQLAMELGISRPEQIKNDPDSMKAGHYLDKIRRQIMEDRNIQFRYGGLVTTLQAAWQNVRNRVMHSDPLNPVSYEAISRAEDHIGLINDAMRQGHKYLIEEGIIKF